MILLLNESEVTDGICVAVANLSSSNPNYENVELLELGQRRNGQFYAVAIYHGYLEDEEVQLNNDQIITGITSFLSEFHNYNFEELGFDGELLINDNGTIGAKIIFNED